MSTVQSHQATRIVGQSLPFRGADEIVTGALRFHTDRYLPEMLHGRVVRSSVPHGRVRRIDIEPALRVAGVVAVLTGRDVPNNIQGVVVPDWPVLADGRVRQVGDPVALVAATSPTAAEGGAAAVLVDIEPLAVIDSPEQALAPGAPLLHENGNLLAEFAHTKGDVDAALARSDCVIDRTVWTPCQDHVCLEPGGGIGLFTDGQITLWCGTQDPGGTRHEVARALAMDSSDVRVIATPMGGAFGSKLDGALPIHLALLAKTTGKPVKIVLSREEVMVAGGKRHPYRIRTQIALDADGAIGALDMDVLADTGPYASEGPTVLKVSAELSTGSYRVPAARFRGRLVYTNNANAGAFRGYGVPQVTFALETALDQAAVRLGIDPVELRRRNALVPGDEQGLYGHVVGQGIRAREVLDAAATHPWWAEREAWRSSSRWPWRRGTGFALATKGVGYGSGRGDIAAARMAITPSGDIHIWAGPNHSGQAIETAYAQIAAETLTCDPENVVVDVSDSELVPESGTCSASRSTYAGGSAVRLACFELLRRLDAAGFRAPTDWAAAGRTLADRGEALVEATFTAPDVEDLGRLEPRSIESLSPHRVYSSAAQVVRAEINELTGETRVPAIACALDCGIAINPAGVIAQAEGGIVQGLGYGLMEEHRLIGAVPETRSLETYLIPTSADVPVMDVVLVEGDEPTGPFGAKGIAEVVLCPTAPALGGAIRDAIEVDLDRPPATPEHLYRRLKEVRS